MMYASPNFPVKSLNKPISVHTINLFQVKRTVAWLHSKEGKKAQDRLDKETYFVEPSNPVINPVKRITAATAAMEAQEAQAAAKGKCVLGLIRIIHFVYGSLYFTLGSALFLYPTRGSGLAGIPCGTTTTTNNNSSNNNNSTPTSGGAVPGDMMHGDVMHGDMMCATIAQTAGLIVAVLGLYSIVASMGRWSTEYVTSTLH